MLYDVLSPGFSPWRLFDEMARMYNRTGFGIGGLALYPAINVWASDDQVTVQAEIPGTKQEDVEITCVGNTLSLKGRREPVEQEEDVTWLRRERPAVEWNRTIQLPFPVNVDGGTAEVVDGILSITLKRLESDKPRRINLADKKSQLQESPS